MAPVAVYSAFINGEGKTEGKNFISVNIINIAEVQFDCVATMEKNASSRTAKLM